MKNSQIQVYINQATQAQIAELLIRCDADFVPQLSSRVAIPIYAEKITTNAARFEAWANSTLCGLVAAYCNDSERSSAYVTNVSVLHEYQGKGIASLLMAQFIKYVKDLGFKVVELEVDKKNVRAIGLYEKIGFAIQGESSRGVVMSLNMKKEV